MNSSSQKMTCREIDEVVLDYVRGMVDKRTAMAIEDHALTCADCRKSINELADMTQVLMACREEAVRSPEHHLQDLMKLARESAPVVSDKKVSIKKQAGFGQWLSDFFKKPFLVPAFSMALCVVVLSGIFHMYQGKQTVNGQHQLNQGQLTINVPFQLVQNIDFPAQTRGNEPETGDLTAPVIWFFAKLPPSAILDVQKKPSPESVLSLIQAIRSGKGSILSESEKAGKALENLQTRIRVGKSQNGDVAVLFEERLFNSLKALPPEEPVVVCMGLSQSTKGIELRLGLYDRWLHGDIESPVP